MHTHSDIEDLIQRSLARGREKVASAQVKTTQPLNFDEQVDKIASVFEQLARNPTTIVKMSEVGPYTGSNSPEVQPPTDESRSTTAVQPKETVGPNPIMSQNGTEVEPGTDEERDTTTDNSAFIAAVTETPKIAGAENEFDTSPTEYAAGDGSPISTTIPFLDSPSATEAFTKRQAKQVSVVDTLKSMFSQTPYDDSVAQQNLTEAEGAGVKTKSGGI